MNSKYKNIVVIGASTVYGEGDPTGGGFVTRLKAWHEQSNPKEHRVFNLGIAAEPIVKIVNRFAPEVSIRKPDLVIYYPGLNDFLRIGSATARNRSDSEKVVSTLTKICHEVKEIAPLVIMTPIPPNEQLTCPFQEKFYFLYEDAQRLAKIIIELKNQNLCEVFDIFNSWRNDDQLNDFLHDGLHCNSLGHQRIFEELCLYLAELK